MIDLDGGIEVCQRKAYTALFGVGTLELGSSIKNDPSLLAGLSHLWRVTVLGGGLPLFAESELVGGIGMGGGTVEQTALPAASFRATSSSADLLTNWP